MTGIFYCLPLTSSWLESAPEDHSRFSQCLNKLNKETCPLVLYGDANCGKTVLLFQAAVAYASLDHHVTFISRRSLSRMPHSVHGMPRPETAGLLKTLTFLYMSDVKDLIQYLSEIHTRALLPDMLIVDDLQYYLHQLTQPAPEAGCARLCAHLIDAVDYINSKRDSGSMVLLLGCQTDKNNMQALFRRFGFSVASIESCTNPTTHYQLDLHTVGVTMTLTYNINQTGLFLQNVTLGT